MIAAEGLTKYYGDTCAIDGLDFQIESGEIVGILGLNGAGKTTTLKILSCLILPSVGKVTINGLDILENPHDIRKQVGFLPEEPPLYREMTVGAFLGFAAEIRGLSRADAKSRVNAVMDITSTGDVENEVIANLSHGYRKRVGIAQSIIHRPPVLILDEPISGLDPVQIVEIREMIKHLKGKHTILISSHILPEISQTCDRILVIQDGKLVASGTEEELTGRVSVSHKLKVMVRGDLEHILKLVKGIEGVVSCETTGESGLLAGKQGDDGEPRKTIHHLQIVTGTDLREEISKELVKGDLGLLQISPAEAELESIFLRLTNTTEVHQ